MRDWILDEFQTYAQRAIVAAMFASPLAFNLATKDVFMLTKLTLLWVIGIGGLAIWIMWSAERGVWIPRFRIGYAALAFLGAYAIATVFSQAKLLSLIGIYGRYGGLIPFVLYAVIMLVIVGAYWEQPENLRRIAKATTLVSALMAIYVLIQESRTDWLPLGPRQPGQGAPGTMGNSNFSGGYLGICAPLFLYMALSSEKKVIRRILQLAFVIDLAAIWFTDARGGFVAVLAGFGVMAIVYREKFPRGVRWVAAGCVALIALLAFVLIVHPGSNEPPATLAKITVFDPETIRQRVWYWVAAWRIFLESPIVGTGPDTFYANYTEHRLSEDGAFYGLTIADKPHNIYFEYLSNSGILGFGTYIALTGLGIFYGYRRARTAKEPQKFLATAFLGFLVAYLAQGFFSIDVPPLAVMGWVALGGIAVLADPKILDSRTKLATKEPPKWVEKRRKLNRQNVQSPRSSRSAGKPWVRGGIPLGALTLMLVGLRPLIADVHARGAEHYMSKGTPDRAFNEIGKAVELNPREARYRLVTASFLHSEARTKASEEDKISALNSATSMYTQALRIQPDDPAIAVPRALTHSARAGFDKSHLRTAVRVWNEAIVNDPTNWDLRYRYAKFLSHWGSQHNNKTYFQKAVKVMRVVVSQRPSEVAAWVDLGKNYFNLSNHSEAAKAAQQALRLNPTDKGAQDLLARAQQTGHNPLSP